MSHLIPSSPPPPARTATARASRWGLSLLLALFLMAPSAWAQTYIVGTNQTTCAGTLYDSGGPTGDYSDSETLTTVLTPATAGAKMRLTFTAFDLEDTYDFVRIYDGPTSAAPRLAELTGTSLPAAVTATNASGQLTVVFTSDGSVTYSGFAATVSCAVNLPSITSFTPTSGPAGTSVVITGINFTGATSVTFSGTPATAFTVNSATQVTATVPANAISGTVCVTTPSGTGCSSAAYSTGNVLIGTNVTTCSGSIYDSGGPNGNYTNSENRTSVLTPANGSKVVLTFTAFDLENNYDFLRIYDGPTTAAPQLVSLTGTSLPATVTATSTNSTGQLTLVFTSDGSGVRAGFAASITCLAPPTCTAVTNLTVSNITPYAATLNFTPGIGNNSYLVTYTPTGGTARTVSAASSPFTLTNLTPATPYTVSIQPQCSTGTSPTITTTATFTTQLPNDDPCGALPITTTPLTASNVGASTSVQNGVITPTCGGGPLPKDVWFAFTANATTSTLTLTGNAAGTVRLYTSPNCSAGPFVEVFCRGSGTANTTVGSVALTGLAVGTRYYLAVSGFGSSDIAGTFTIAATNVLATRTQADTEALVVYPNPSNTGQLSLKLSGLHGAGQATLLNALGQVALTQALTSANAEQTLTTAKLATGIYTLRVAVDGQVLTRKVVLN
jgi:hypothetical protein